MLRRFLQYVPGLEGALAYRTFCTPRLSSYRSPEYNLLAKRARIYLKDAICETVPTTVGAVKAYVLEPRSPGPSRQTKNILLVHGWTGEASFMSAFAEYFRRRGFRAVLFDCPAHGTSPGQRTSLVACAHAVREIAIAMGPIHFAVAHSMGGLAALHAGEGGPPMPRAYPFLAYVFIALPNRFSEITSKFGIEQHLSSAAQLDFERRLERVAHRKISSFTGANMLRATGRPALLIHSRDDTDVAYHNAEQVAAACSEAELQTFDGLGHRQILYTPDVVRNAARYLEQKSQDLTSP